MPLPRGGVPGLDQGSQGRPVLPREPRRASTQFPTARAGLAQEAR